jgi:hypothetical protein
MYIFTHAQPVRRWFQLGQVTITPDATTALDASEESLTDLLIRHQTGNWGIVSRHEQPRHEYTSTNYGNVMSVHPLSTGAKVWIITERDVRRVTA